METLQKFLTKYCVNTGKTNITSLDGKWGGKWYIPPEDYNDFLIIYANTAKKFPLRFVEKKETDQELYYMFADVDISKEDIDLHYSGILPENFLNQIVEVYEDIVKQWFIDPILNLIISCRLKQPNKMHLHFNGLIVNNEIGKNIRISVIDILKQKFNGNWDKWIDAASYTCTGLRLLGSLKPMEKMENRYYVVDRFDKNNKPINPKIELALDDIKATSIRIVNKDIKLHNLNPNFYLCNKIVSDGKNPDYFIKKNVITSNTESKIINTKISPDVLKVIEKAFMDTWTVDNYGEYVKMFSVGPIINMGNHYIMKSLNKMSCPIKGTYHKRKSSCNYHIMGPDGICIKCHDESCKGKRYPSIPIPLPIEVKNMFINNLNISLETKTSSVELNFMGDSNVIKVFDNDEKNKILLKALNGGETSMAKLLYSCCNDKNYFSKEQGWWHWDGTKWRNDGKFDIAMALYDDIGEIIKKVRALYIDNYENKNLKEKRDENEQKIVQLDKLLKRLELKQYQFNIIGQAELVFHTQRKEPYLENLLNSNPYLIGFPNGVYDILKQEFREAKSSDYITITLDYLYSPEVDSEISKDLVFF